MFRLIRNIKRLIVFIVCIALIIVIVVGVLGARYPIAYKDIIVKYSKENKLDPYLVSSIISIESKFNKEAISNKEAKGLMQISPTTGKWASEVLGIENYSEELLFDPEINIKIGTWYLSTLFKEFDDNLDLVLAAYNAGSGNVNKWLKDERYSVDNETLSNIPFNETKEYLDKVKKSYNIYSSLYKKYILNPNDKDSIYINLLHNMRKILKETIGNI